MSRELILGVVRPFSYAEEKDLFREIKKILKNRTFYYSRTEKHALVFFISGTNTGLSVIATCLNYIKREMRELGKKYKFTLSLEVFGCSGDENWGYDELP